ncbi:MAG: protein kinase [Thermoguttaceae bacterium]|jgi:serine/threonine-protein kinase
MELTYACLSSQGPVRGNNEDFLGFWSPPNQEVERSHGALAVIADGVGGQGQGEVASQLAVQAALDTFRQSKPDVPPRQVLWQVFNAANLAVYDRGMADRGDGRMATTLTAAVFRHNEVTLGHVGDCRAYLIQGGRIRQLTADHSYVAMQLKLGLISAKDAAASSMRNLLVRSVGRDPVIQVDLFSQRVGHGDLLVQCSDGLHQHVAEEEIAEIVTHVPPDEACRQLVALAEKRGTDDNLSVQVVRIDRVEEVMFYRGLPIYRELELPMSNEVEVGQVLDGRFRITDLVSRSGMASIFKAVDLSNGQPVAVKIPFLQFESDPAFFSRFQREEAIGATLNHPYVLRIVPVQEKTRPYIVMEYLEGQTLRQLLQGIERMPVADALAVAARICEALEYLHAQNVVHRDLKPENVMLCRDGSIRVMDFGIAKAAGLRRLTFSGFSASLGTPDYMAPEQVKGKRGDARTDLYSLGVMLYEMVTGALPFEGSNPYAIMHARLVGDPVAPRKWNPDVPPTVEEIILHALERQPFDRYPSAAAMRAEMENPDSVVLTGRHERLRPQVPWRSHWRSMRLVVLAVLLPVLLLGALLLVAYLRRR